MINQVVITKTFEQPEIDIDEILRYAGCKNADNSMLSLVCDCLSEIKGELSYRLCYTTLDVNIIGDKCDFKCFSFNSNSLSKNLQQCDKAILFAATLGTSIDRVILKYSRIAPSRAVIFQAIAAERIEALCDAFCKEFENAARRFSPGYGDLPITVQKDIFKLLNCHKNIGLTLNDSMLMSPTKSVTAFVGIKGSLNEF